MNLFIMRLRHEGSIKLLQENKIASNKNTWFVDLKKGDLVIVSTEESQSNKRELKKLLEFKSKEDIPGTVREIASFDLLKEYKNGITTSIAARCKYFDLDINTLNNLHKPGGGAFKICIREEVKEEEKDLKSFIKKIDFEKDCRDIYIVQDSNIPNKKDGNIYIQVGNKENGYKIQNVLEYNEKKQALIEYDKLFENCKNLNIKDYGFVRAFEIAKENEQTTKIKNLEKIINDLDSKKYYEFRSKKFSDLYDNLRVIENARKKKNTVEVKIENNVNDNIIDSDYYEFSNYCKDRGFYYNEDLIRRFVMSLQTKKFLILTGISGTGKTKIAQLWGDYICKNSEEDKLIIPVGSNWNDNKKLLGFKNILLANDENNYEKTQLVKLFESANSIENSEKQYIVILDEMNLSYVERYFSDFLSALETGDEIKLPNDKTIKWTDNIKVIGTVNIDETTYMFSPKVLDRANVIEMNGIKPKDYIEKIINSKEKRYYKKLKENREIFEKYEDILNSLYEITKSGLFAYRTIDEITKYIVLNLEISSEDNWEKYLDEQIIQKILPKLHGNSGEIMEILIKIEEVIENENYNYQLTKKKVEYMKDECSKKGYTSFI